MVGTHGFQAGCQFGSSERNDLIGMKFQFETLAAGCFQQTFALFDRENALFAKDIAEGYRMFCTHMGQHSFYYVIDICVRTPGKLRRDSMCTEESRDHIQRVFVVQLLHDTKLDQLGRQVKTVTTLSFDSSHAHIHHSVETVVCIAVQVIIAGVPGRIHRIDDPASPFHDRHIAVSFHPPRELLLAVTTEDEVRMAIHKPWQKRTSGSVYFQIISDIHLPEDLFSRSHMRDNTIRYSNRPVLDYPDIGHSLPLLRFKTRTSHHLRRIPYQYLFVFHRLSHYPGFQYLIY